ncbi:CPBP family glutamic-type intramembrane protease [Empedobacter sp.]|uniref:CPBP family glutamic-type intramembrane protease n=1 Tax=Empedobacter sp. TaxID=1927715 RepID=UPI00289F4E23|nr:CPBP family glutamic-type intramembrane protease [Empedobacter sp.]
MVDLNKNQPFYFYFMFFNIFNNTISPLNLKEKFKKVFISYVLVIFGCFISVFFIQITDLIITKSFHYPSVKDLFHQSRIDIDSYGLIKIAILIPLLEEILFRLFLIPKKINIYISVSFILFLLINGSFFYINIYNKYLYIALASIVLMIFILKNNISFLQNFIKNYNNKIIVINIIIFGLIHLTNIDSFYWKLFLFYPIFVLPQMVMAYFIINLRMKLGFFWGVFLHVIINLISTLIFN